MAGTMVPQAATEPGTRKPAAKKPATPRAANPAPTATAKPARSATAKRRGSIATA
jgi:hypothetical protein